MTSRVLDPYDEFLYPNYSYPQTHPDQLGSLATFFGMKPAPVEHCRVLELACGDGANLIPMAFYLPDSQFVGIDRATQPVASGKKMIEVLNLKNLTLEVGDILEFPANLGKFDYIIAHGLYSWVPAVVQERILEICRSHLQPHGVAYVSYNVYPGCHLRAILRGMMLFHTREITDSHERIAQALQVTKWVANAQTKTNGYALLMKELSEAVAKRDGAVIYHDDLAETNTPLYFHQFVTNAARHGLQFLSEAEYFNALGNEYPPEVIAQLRSMEADDVLGKEQYQDFIDGRSFRQTLLCHHEVKLDRSMRPEIVTQFYIRAPTAAVSDTPDITSEVEEEQFRGPSGSMISTSSPIAKAALAYLGEIYPSSVRFEDLLLNSYRRLNRAIEASDLSWQNSEEPRALAEVIIRAYGAGVVQLRLHEPKFSRTPGERPMVSWLARLQSQQGPLVTSLLNNSVRFEDVLSRQLLSLLDGTRDRKMLLEELGRLLDENRLASSAPTVLSEEREKTMSIVADQLEEHLSMLGRLGFLLA